ncbi:lipoyl(octanoyl) transferase LipB [Neolewinella lacunae]|uniref:Octanoyltransferase n=1 Tax=Neolewinella lacunae TaxID=1517758 RepID=A0A923PLS3_9BACT|nr:lipoyl(octanoyl) transferase LipB [Neolewinella lacunae]MBC6994021.1 lipoyl(octanoyl) transferase LipB [Neolewinella lacunae]MDN3634691.1 lipoyl(octanoyl) transferase LipB [Neolewinella lacunae]
MASEPTITRAPVAFRDLGRLGYQEAWDLQTDLHTASIARKRRNRELVQQGTAPEPLRHHLLFVEHPPVYTLGKSGSADHLLLSAEELAAGGFTFHRINRGGDITYHGPGQLVAYPIFDLEDFFTDVHRYVRFLEEVVIRTCADFGLAAERDAGYTGVWLPGDTEKGLARRKICAIGVHLSRWVTLHGFAFNVCPDLNHFGHIVPCGIAEADRSVTSLSQELGRRIALEEVKPLVQRHFQEVFGFSWAEPTNC